jgi:hypothetical protein
LFSCPSPLRPPTKKKEKELRACNTTTITHQVLGGWVSFPLSPHQKKEKKQKLRICNTTITHKVLCGYSLPHFSHKKNTKSGELATPPPSSIICCVTSNKEVDTCGGINKESKKFALTIVAHWGQTWHTIVFLLSIFPWKFFDMAKLLLIIRV